jgi:MFS family permease
MVIVGAWLPVEGVILPVHFDALDQPQQLGITIMATALGGLLGAVAYSAWGARGSPHLTFALAVLLAGIGVMGMALMPPFPIFLVAAFLAGLAYGPVGPVVNLAMQNRSPFRLRGRVVSLMTSMAYVAGPLGYVLIGPGVQAWGVTAVFLAVGVVIAVMGALALPMRSLRAIDDGPLYEAAAE